MCWNFKGHKEGCREWISNSISLEFQGYEHTFQTWIPSFNWSNPLFELADFSSKWKSSKCTALICGCTERCREVDNLDLEVKAQQHRQLLQLVPTKGMPRPGSWMSSGLVRAEGVVTNPNVKWLDKHLKPMRHYWREHSWSSSKPLSNSECTIFDSKIYIAMWTSPGKSTCTNPFNSILCRKGTGYVRANYTSLTYSSTCLQPQNPLPC